MTDTGPVIMRDTSTPGTPSSVVSGSASASASPTGMKSQPTWESMANRAGSAYCGGICPAPICVPIRTPMMDAITAPGPSSGDRIGIEQMNDKITRPMMLLASAVRPPAIQSPTPVLVIRPIRKETKAMNGSTFLRTMSMVSRPAWYRVATMLPTNLPTLVTTLDRPVTNPFFLAGVAVSTLLVVMSGHLRLWGSSGHDAEDDLGGAAAEEDHDQADQEVADRKVADRQVLRGDAG